MHGPCQFPDHDQMIMLSVLFRDIRPKSPHAGIANTPDIDVIYRVLNA